VRNLFRGDFSSRPVAAELVLVETMCVCEKGEGLSPKVSCHYGEADEERGRGKVRYEHRIQTLNE